MRSRLFVAAMLALSGFAACKDKPGDTREAADEPVTEPAASAGDDAAAEQAGPKNALGDEPHVAYRADTGEANPAVWTIEGTDIALRVEQLEGNEGSFVAAQVMAKVGDSEDGKETGIYTCKNLNKDAGGYIDFMLRADNLHVRCINPAKGDEPGDTEAARFAFDSSQDAVVAAGNYSGEGVVDPDTIELDEGE